MADFKLSDYIWDSADIEKNGRENLGEQMPVMAYRLFQYALRDYLVERYGKDEMIDIFRNTGRDAGRLYAQNMLDLSQELGGFVAQLQQSLQASKIGILQFESLDSKTGEAVVTVREDLDCSGLPILGETTCNYDEGFIAGILEAYTKLEYTVTEVDCWTTGGRVCRFVAKVKD